MSSLPVELQREIFEIAMRSNQKDAALKLKLSLVAHHVHFWVDTVFYETVTILSDASGTKFVKLIDSKPSGFFGPVVKSLLMMSVRAPSCARILSTCPGIHSLAWWVREDPTPALSNIVSRLPLQRLVLAFKYLTFFIGVLPPPIWLSTLTHLETSVSFDADLEQLRLVPGLTHISLYAPQDRCPQIVVDNCPNLRILVIIAGRHAPAPVSEALVDPRIVVEPDSDEFVDDWEAAQFGLPNMWTRAEDVLTERLPAPE
ncbi:hypothetical protein MSAN_02246200 [Mycena sanguinolenta]|uniref:F-box domain-containing protein n=1 Tax=Mycena sanguinolenta TaxID=230812 RepID=A0A8H6XBY4_9AGAR|nr:hypothetical protein MSAN_02246200 [Mycena sanguinolenta]